MLGSVLAILFSVQDLHRDTFKHACSSQTSTSNVQEGNGQMLCSVTNPGFSLKGRMVKHRSTEDAIRNIPQYVSRKMQSLDVEVSDVGWYY